MQNILDHLYSSSFMMTAFIMVIIFGFIGISFLNPFKIKLINYTYKGLCYIIPFVTMMSINFFYYGFTDQINEMMVCGNKFCFLDYSERSDDSSDESVYRLNIGNIETGEKLFRKYAGWSAKLLQVSGKTLIYEADKNCVLFDMDKFEEMKRYTPEFLQASYPEFSSGIESSDIEKHDNYGLTYIVIKVMTKDGKIWFVNPLNSKIIPKVADNKGFTKFRFSSQIAIIKYKSIEDSNGKYFMEFLNTSANSIRQKLIVEKDTCDIDFIDPKFMEIFPDLEVVIIKSYTNTDKLDFLISSVNFKAKLLWQHSRNDLKGLDKYTNKPGFDIAQKHNKNLLFNSGGFVYYMDVLKDSVKWKTRF